MITDDELGRLRKLIRVVAGARLEFSKVYENALVIRKGKRTVAYDRDGWVCEDGGSQLVDPVGFNKAVAYLGGK